MSVSNELNTLKSNISSAYTMIQNKGGTIPINKNTQNLSSAINTIPTGGSVDEYFIDTIDDNYAPNLISSIKKYPSFAVTKSSILRFFSGCVNLLSVGNITLGKDVNDIRNLFNGCSNLTTVGLITGGNITSVGKYVFSGCTNLSNFGGIQNLGKAYVTSVPAYNETFSLVLSETILTHDSLMNVINNLYDIATKGCNVQKLQLGTNNMAKLTAEEIAIATNKGWSVS